MQLKLLFLSTPVGALGSGIGGGVELTVKNVALEMRNRGHQVTIVAPTGSVLDDLSIQEIPGNLQVSIQTQDPTQAIAMPENSVLANMCQYIRDVQADWDLIVNFAYDWLPFYLTPFFQTPVLHFVTMGAVTPLMTQTIVQFTEQNPQKIAFCTQSQAETFGLSNPQYCLGGGLNLSLYQFCDHPKPVLAWIGRISPEKALEDAIAVAEAVKMPLNIFGKLQDKTYWEQVRQAYPEAIIDYRGFLSTQALQSQLRHCQALLMTPRWVEAFGNVVIEALACGVPVVAYRRGGPAEIIRPGESGFLVEPDNITEMIDAVNQVNQLNRYHCRQQAERNHSLSALGDRFEPWFMRNL